MEQSEAGLEALFRLLSQVDECATVDFLSFLPGDFLGGVDVMLCFVFCG